MFRLKVIFFVAALSVVNAAITVNIYDDEDTDVTAVKDDFQEVHGCIKQVCDKLCRILKFPGGSCVNGRCICNNIKQIIDVEETLHLESSLQEVRSCNNQACDQLCRRLQFPGGACVNGRCKCDNFKQPELVLKNVKDLGSCDWRACDQLCRRLGFPGGVCVGDNCKCDNFKQTELVLENDKDLGSCNWRACDQLCRRLGFPGGVCVGDKCKCDNFRLDNNEDLVTVNDLSANKKENANECNNVECENYCQKLGLPSGYCYQDQCICYKKNIIDEAKTLQRCDVVACNEMCHRMNYIGGMCRNGSCYCY